MEDQRNKGHPSGSSAPISYRVVLIWNSLPLWKLSHKGVIGHLFQSSAVLWTGNKWFSMWTIFWLLSWCGLTKEVSNWCWKNTDLRINLLEAFELILSMQCSWYCETCVLRTIAANLVTERKGVGSTNTRCSMETPAKVTWDVWPGVRRTTSISIWNRSPCLEMDYWCIWLYSYRFLRNKIKLLLASIKIPWLELSVGRWTSSRRGGFWINYLHTKH